MDRLNTVIARTFARLQREEGQATLEYALVLVALAAIVATAIFTGLGADLKNKLDGIVS